MTLLSPAELYAVLLFVAAAGVLVIVAISRSPQKLQDDIASRLEQSIAVLENCKDGKDAHR